MLDDNITFGDMMETENEELIDECITFLQWLKEEIKDSLVYVSDAIIRELYLTFEKFIQYSIRIADEESPE